MYNARRKERMGDIYYPKSFPLMKTKVITKGKKEYKSNGNGIPVLDTYTPPVTKKVFDTNKFNDLCQAVWEYYLGTKLKRISSEGKYRPELGRFIQSTNKGFADLHGIHEGRAVYIETKQPKESQLKSQRDFQKWVQDGGGYYFIVRSFDSIMNVVGMLCNVSKAGATNIEPTSTELPNPITALQTESQPV